MASKKKKQEAVAGDAVVDAPPVEVVEQAEQLVEQVAEVVEQVEVIEEAERVEIDEWPPNDASDEPGDAPIEEPGIEEADEVAEDEPAEVAPSEMEVERARLADLWRLNGVPTLKAVAAQLRALIEGITSQSNVHRPARVGEHELTTADLIAELERAGEQDHAVELRRWYRCNHRRAGISIYVLLALAQLDEVADEQEPAEGS